MKMVVMKEKYLLIVLAVLVKDTKKLLSSSFPGTTICHTA